jgi:hypothetical protein
MKENAAFIVALYKNLKKFASFWFFHYNIARRPDFGNFQESLMPKSL